MLSPHKFTVSLALRRLPVRRVPLALTVIAFAAFGCSSPESSNGTPGATAGSAATGVGGSSSGGTNPVGMAGAAPSAGSGGSSAGTQSSGGSSAGGGGTAGSATGGLSGGGSGGTASGGGSPIPVMPDCPAPTGAAVTLTAVGSGYAVTNGLATIDINSAGQLTQLTVGSKNLMGSGDSLYVSEAGGAAYYSIKASAHSVVTETADLVELSFTDTAGGLHDMDWELHYVMRRGVTGFYYFLIAKVGTATHPNPATLSELRTVQRFSQSILPNGYNGERHGALPTASQNATFTSASQIQDSTWALPGTPNPLPGVSSVLGLIGQKYDDGPVFSKYDWATYRLEDLVHGLYGNGYGAWLISPSWEFYTGGPVKQELMVHHSNLILNMYHGGHFGSATTGASPAKWQKLYGPNLLYVNTGADDAVIADALARGATERAQWPYCWMNNGLFPLAAARGTVAGKLAEAHGQSVAGAMVVLAQSGPLLNQGYDYQFWAQADDAGTFTIPEVRPGTYQVHAYATQGTIIDDPMHGEIIKSVSVSAGQNALGTLTWSPPYHAKLLWSIGSSDQRSGEFRFSPSIAAGPANTASHTGRMYGPDADHGVWTVPPATTTYTIGASTPLSDWYFVQGASGTWTVKFDLSSVPAGGAFLTLGLSGAARGAGLVVAVNGHQALSQTFGNDQSLYRSANQGGAFQMLTAAIPAANLKVGANTATFTATAMGGAGIYYDVLKLESD